MKTEIKINGNFTEVRVDAQLNKGNYESEKVGVTFALAEGDNVFTVINMCKDVVYGRAVTGKAEVKKELKTEAAKEEAAVVIETLVEEAKAEEVVVTPKKEAVKKEKKVAVKVLATPYDRTNESHKRLLSAFLDKAQSNWKTKELLTKASKISQKFSDDKVDFLDADGVPLMSFKEKFLEQLRAE